MIQNSPIPDTNIETTPRKLTAIEKERYRILGLDPRSPAADFNRTPILLPKSLALLKARSQDNLNRKGSYETDVYNPRNSWQERSILLSDSEIELLPDIASKRLKQLNSETRAELNILNVPVSDTDSSVFGSEENITVIKNSKSKSTNDRSLITDEQTFAATDKREDNTNKQNDRMDVIEQNMRTMRTKDDNKIKIWHDAVASEEQVPSRKVKEEEIRENIERELSQEDVLKENLTLDEYTTKNTSPSKLMKIANVPKKEVEENMRKILKTDVIKSDEKKVFSPDNKYGNEVPKVIHKYKKVTYFYKC